MPRKDIQPPLYCLNHLAWQHNQRISFLLASRPVLSIPREIYEIWIDNQPKTNLVFGIFKCDCRLS